MFVIEGFSEMGRDGGSIMGQDLLIGFACCVL